jgi:hypothetical protein
MEKGHVNPQAFIVFKFLNSLIPQYLALFRAWCFGFRIFSTTNGLGLNSLENNE